MAVPGNQILVGNGAVINDGAVVEDQVIVGEAVWYHRAKSLKAAIFTSAIPAKNSAL